LNKKRETQKEGSELMKKNINTLYMEEMASMTSGERRGVRPVTSKR